MQLKRLRALYQQCRRFAHAQEGVSAVEFALLAPVLISIYLGSCELCQAFMAQRRADHTAAAVADLVAQSQSVSSADLTDIYTIASSLMKPFPSTTLSVRISSVTESAKGVDAVDWSSSNGVSLSAYATGAVVTVPTDMIASGESVIMTDITYVYSSPIVRFLPKSVTFKQTYYLRPRTSTTVAKT